MNIRICKITLKNKKTCMLYKYSNIVIIFNKTKNRLYLMLNVIINS